MKAVIAIVLSLMLVLSVPLESVAAQTGRPPIVVPVNPLQCDVCAAHGLSKAVVFGTLGTLRQFHSRLKTGDARSGDARAALTSLRILFAHLDETGTTKAVEQSILEKEEQLIRFNPARADAEKLQKQHATFGITRTVDEELTDLATSTVNDRLQVLEQIKTGGLHSFYAQVLARYADVETKLIKAEKSGRPPLEKVWIAGCEYDKVAAFMGIGCAFGCAGCCIIGAIALFFRYAECA